MRLLAPLARRTALNESMGPCTTMHDTGEQLTSPMSHAHVQRAVWSTAQFNGACLSSSEYGEGGYEWRVLTTRSLSCSPVARIEVQGKGGQPGNDTAVAAFHVVTSVASQKAGTPKRTHSDRGQDQSVVVRGWLPGSLRPAARCTDGAASVRWLGADRSRSPPVACREPQSLCSWGVHVRADAQTSSPVRWDESNGGCSSNMTCVTPCCPLRSPRLGAVRAGVSQFSPWWSVQLGSPIVHLRPQAQGCVQRDPVRDRIAREHGAQGGPHTQKRGGRGEGKKKQPRRSLRHCPDRVMGGRRRTHQASGLVQVSTP